MPIPVPDLAAVRFDGAPSSTGGTEDVTGRSITHRGVVIGGAGAALEGAHGVPSSPCADGDAAARARMATRRRVRGWRRVGACADGDAAARGAPPSPRGRPPTCRAGASPRSRRG